MIDSLSPLRRLHRATKDLHAQALADFEAGDPSQTAASVAAIARADRDFETRLRRTQQLLNSL
jgi:hypothetical protein